MHILDNKMPSSIKWQNFFVIFVLDIIKYILDIVTT